VQHLDDAQPAVADLDRVDLTGPVVAMCKRGQRDQRDDSAL
jgi:hypothetical protein